MEEARADVATSHYDAYARVGSPAAASKSTPGYAAQFAQRTIQLPEYYSCTPKKTISVVNRPKMPASKKNVENLDVQFEKDKEAFERRANSYRRLAGEKAHHHRLPSSIITLWEAGHIVDRGKGKAGGSVYDPINHDFRVPPPAGSSSSVSARSQSAPRVHRSDVRVQQGSYDPILHSYTQQPDPAYEAQKERDFQRSTGAPGVGTAIRVDPVRASFDPILGQCRPASPGPRIQQQPSQRSASAPRPASASPSIPAERPATPGRRPRAVQGASWGTYDPILHHWAVPPSDARFHDQNAVVNQQAGISGSHVRKSEPPANQGVYNPILNQWVVPPANPKIIPGLSFAPASLFSLASPKT